MNAGLPTALAVSSVIAVGTSHGLVLVFGSSCLNHHFIASLPLATAACIVRSDPKQVLQWMLGSVDVGKQFGAVSALTFNRDSDRLLVGFARGQVS